MVVFLLVALVAVIALVPRWWVERTIRRHGEHRPDLPGTGGELAAHLLRHHEVTGIRLERAKTPPHFDPKAAVIRLDEATFDGRSISAVAIAAHEFGHALQHAGGERGLRLRNRIVSLAAVTDRFAGLFFIAAPVLGLVLRSPGALLAPALVGIGLLAVRLLAHLVTLPVEYDASFGKALPILREGGYLRQADLEDARSVLKAAALTYVAQAAMSLFDIGRWLRGLRF